MTSLIDIAKKVLKIESNAIYALIKKLDSGFQKAVELIYNAKGRIIVIGIGKSGLVGKKISATLASTGTPSFFMHPVEASHGDLGMVAERDIIIAISNSGETEEITNLIPFLKRFNISIIALTGNPKSTLARFADISLDISVEKEACPFGIIPTASTTATLAMGDAMAIALLSKRGLKKEDFALYHPGGNLGRQFFITVKDLMHKGNSLPLISQDMPMLKSLVKISSKRLGIGIIINKQKYILGIITDGDIRRGIEKWGKDFFDMKTMDVMTKNPKTILEDNLAAKALSIMQENSITSLVVPDKKGKIIGLIHLHDILKKGITRET